MNLGDFEESQGLQAWCWKNHTSESTIRVDLFTFANACPPCRCKECRMCNRCRRRHAGIPKIWQGLLPGRNPQQPPPGGILIGSEVLFWEWADAKVSQIPLAAIRNCSELIGSTVWLSACRYLAAGARKAALGQLLLVDGACLDSKRREASTKNALL